MKELKILAVVVFFTLVIYWGVEPFAHSQMHKHVEGDHFAYSDLPELTKTGDAANGQSLVMGAGACLGCHAMESQGMSAPMDASMAAASYGVNPPDLSNIGALYDEKFLAALIKNPAHALNVEHKFDQASGNMHPMTQFFGAGGDIDQEVADMVAYFKSIAPQEITPKTAFDNACGRCHAMRYDNYTQLGDTPSFDGEKEALAHKIKVLEYQDHLKAYMGKLPPDLSMIIRARGGHFLETFVENPQTQLPGTSMPRVGLTKAGYEKVEEYLTEIGDPSKSKREALGPWVIGFFVIFTLLAFLWKRSQWRDLH
ncbi:MAG TPA: c-type cytochrome [Sulfurovum sp.]|uniref:c-type cytochrome n=1 Tax=Sulfurovum sp. TaxID=1969726 RepID=UPI002F924AFB